MLTSALTACYKLKNVFGHKIEDLPDKRKGYIWLMGDYDMNVVERAFKHFLLHGEGFPEPVDIEKIINPVEELDKAFYVKANKWLEANKDAGFSWQEQDYKAYVKKYEDAKMRPEGSKEDWLSIEGSKELLKKITEH